MHEETAERILKSAEALMIERGYSAFSYADISEAVDVAKKRIGSIPGTRFVQADLFQLPFAPATFDLVWSEGVMHHTPSTRTALQRLNRLLKPGGHMMFYVYKKKAVLIIGADLSQQHPLLAFQIRANVRHHSAHIYVTGKKPVREDKIATRAGHYTELRDKLPDEQQPKIARSAERRKVQSKCAEQAALFGFSLLLCFRLCEGISHCYRSSNLIPPSV